MKASRKAKSAFLTSLVSLVLCFSMLLGTTYAWFTDTASTAVNKIQAGTLDVQLLMYDGTNGYVDISNNDRAIFGTDSIAQNNNAQTLWEPGKTQVAYLQIKNNGSLDLKYQVALDVTNVSKDMYKAMRYAITPDAAPGSVTAWTSGNEVAVGRQIVSTANTTTANPAGVVLEAGQTHSFALSVHMIEEADNTYQGGQVDFDLTVFATQLNAESDSFDTDYDKNAQYPVQILTTGNLPVSVATSGGTTIVETTAPTTIGDASNGDMAVTYPAGVKLNTTAAADATTVAVDQGIKHISNTASSTSVVVADGQSVEHLELTLPVDPSNDTVLVTAEFNYGAGKQIDKLYHNGAPMATSADPASEYYEYNATTGILTLHVFHASPIDVVYKAPVALVNGVKYYDFQEALNAGGNVVLQKDVKLDEAVTIAAEKTVVLDLNGKVIAENGTGARKIVNRGVLTIKNSSKSATGGEIRNTAVGAAGQDGAYGLVDNYGTLTIESGTFTDVAHGNGSSFRNRSGAALTINGGTFVSTADDSVISSGYTGAANAFVYSDGVNVEINGGTFTMQKANYTPAIKIVSGTATINNATISTYKSGGIEVAGGNLTIKNADISVSDKNSYYANAIAVSNDGIANIENGSFTGYSFGTYIYTSGGTINISGGVFEAGTAVLKADNDMYAPKNGSTINVSGGQFTGMYSIDSEATLSITGGTFSADPAPYVNSGTHTVTESNGTYTVTAN